MVLIAGAFEYPTHHGKKALFAALIRIMSSAIIAVLLMASKSAFSQPVSVLGPGTFPSNDAFLQYVGQQTFNYFWTEANTTNGLISIRSDEPDTCSIAAVGFGLSSICVAIDEGWITRDQGRARVLAALQTLYNAPQGSGASGYAGYQGWFYHHLDMNTGLRDGTSELSSSDTACLMSGVIDAGIYFNETTNADEGSIRTLSSNLFNRINFQFMLNTNNNTVYLQWTPEQGFTNVGGYTGYNEVAYLYIYGLGTTNNPLPAASWAAWVSGIQWKTYYGYSYAWIPELFCYQYSHCWIDFQGMPDAYMLAKGSDYFQNSQAATLAQQAYAIANPGGFPNYGSNEWGLTSCSAPSGYVTCGAPGGTDIGTIAPTAAAGSMPFAPEVCLPAILYMYDKYTNNLWTTEGFRDSYDIASNNWFCPATLAIDEGPIVLMIENYRTGSIWNRMMTSPIIQRGLERAGFTASPPNSLTTTLVSSNEIDVSWSGISSYQTGYEVLVSSNGVIFSAAATVASNVYNTTISWPPNIPCFIQVVTTSAAGTSGAVLTNVVNQPPTLDPINNLIINENAGLQTVNLYGITAGSAGQNQTITVTAASSNTNLIPNPTVIYTSPGTNGSLTFSPVPNTTGTVGITVTVSPGGMSNITVTQTFTDTVNTTLPCYEPFNYPAGLNLPGLGGWVVNTAGNSPTGFITAGNLGTFGLAPSIGNHYFWSNNITIRLLFGAESNGPLYFSFLLRATNTPDYFSEDAIGGTAYSSSTALYPKIGLYWLNSSQYQIGMAKGGVSGYPNIYTNPAVFNATQTVFMVGMIYITNVSGFPNADSVSAWFNPNPTNYGAAVAPPPDIANLGSI